MSGMITWFSPSRYSCALNVTGLLAISTKYFAWTVFILLLLTASSSPAKTKTSTSSAMSSSLVIFSPSKSTNRPPSLLNFCNFSASRPFASKTAVCESLAETSVQLGHIWSIVVAKNEPTLPKPCTAYFMGFSPLSSSVNHSVNANTPPRPVAASRPRLPPLAMVLPVKLARDESPVSFSYSSTIQSIIVPLVFTSGAGIS